MTRLLWIAAIVLLVLVLKRRRPAPPPRFVHRAPALTAQYAALHKAKLAAERVKHTINFLQVREAPAVAPYDMLAAYRPKLEK